MRHEYLRALHASRQRGRRRPAGQPQLPAARARRRDRRRLPALPEGPLVRRVRLRLGLGRRLPAPRPALLPEAARRGAVHAGARAAPAGARRRGASCCCAAMRAVGARRPGCRRRTCCSSTTPTSAALERRRLDDAPARVQFHWTNRTPAPYADFADFLGQPAARQAQEDPAGAAPRRRRRRRRSTAREGARSTPADWDFFYRCYTADLPGAPLHALPDARLLRAHGARRCQRTG